MKQEHQECDVCGKSLESPLARARGIHEACVEKSDGETYIEK